MYLKKSENACYVCIVEIPGGRSALDVETRIAGCAISKGSAMAIVGREENYYVREYGGEFYVLENKQHSYASVLGTIDGEIRVYIVRSALMY